MSSCGIGNREQICMHASIHSFIYLLNCQSPKYEWKMISGGTNAKVIEGGCEYSHAAFHCIVSNPNKLSCRPVTQAFCGIPNPVKHVVFYSSVISCHIN